MAPAVPSGLPRVTVRFDVVQLVDFGPVVVVVVARVVEVVVPAVVVVVVAGTRVVLVVEEDEELPQAASSRADPTIPGTTARARRLRGAAAPVGSCRSSGWR